MKTKDAKSVTYTLCKETKKKSTENKKLLGSEIGKGLTPIKSSLLKFYIKQKKRVFLLNKAKQVHKKLYDAF